MKRNPLQSVTQKIRNTLLDMLRKKEIDKKLFNYLLVKNPQLGRFYLLPKIHKRMTNVPGHPVTSNNGTRTENISSYLDYHLKSLIPNVPHILEDTRDFVNRIKTYQISQKAVFLCHLILLACTLIYHMRRV